MWLKVLFIAAALVVCVGATNIYNFMDGINGITAGYSLAVLVPLILFNLKTGFLEQSLLIVTTMSVLVFSVFNFRPRGRAKMLCRRCRKCRNCVHPSLCHRHAHRQDRRHYMAYTASGIRNRRMHDDSHRIMLHENLGEAIANMPIN